MTHLIESSPICLEFALKPRPSKQLAIASGMQLRILLICETVDETPHTGLFRFENCETVKTTFNDAVKLLRHQSFDVAIAMVPNPTQLHALRAGAPENLAIVAAGPEPVETAAVQFCQSLADEYLCLTTLNLEHVKWTVHRAVERRQLLLDALQLRSARTQSRDEDYHAAIHQVRALRSAMLEHPESTPTHPPEWLIAKLSDLLKAYVVSVSSSLHGEVETFVEGLSQSGVTMHETLMAHSLATEQILLGIGNRPGWHAFGRSQILALQLTMFFFKSSKPDGELSGTYLCEATLANATQV